MNVHTGFLAAGSGAEDANDRHLVDGTALQLAVAFIQAWHRSRHVVVDADQTDNKLLPRAAARSLLGGRHEACLASLTALVILQGPCTLGRGYVCRLDTC